jgi:hypothetical protein
MVSIDIGCIGIVDPCGGAFCHYRYVYSLPCSSMVISSDDLVTKSDGFNLAGCIDISHRFIIATIVVF